MAKIKKTVVITRVIEIEIDTDKVTQGYYSDGVIPDKVFTSLAKDIAGESKWGGYADYISARPTTDKNAVDVPGNFLRTDFYSNPQ